MSQILGSGYCGSDLIFLPNSEASAGQAFAVAFPLVALDLAQYGAKSFIGDDRALGDVRVFVEEDSEGEGLVFVADLNASVRHQLKV